METLRTCVQDYRRDGSDDDRVAGESSEGGHDGDCDQRTNYFECLSDGEGEDAAENGAILAGSCLLFMSRIGFLLLA